MALIPGTTTEWEDIQVKLGNFAPREQELSRDEIEAQLIAAAEDVDVFAKTSLSTLERLCENDGAQDDELLELERIRNRRLEEMQSLRARPFGCVGAPLSRASFVTEVTEASRKSLVVTHLLSHRSAYCDEMKKLFDYLAKKYPEVKFCRGVASEVVGSAFPESNLPYVVVYSNGNCVDQLNRAKAEEVLSSIKKHRVKGLKADSEDESEPELTHSGVTRLVMNRVGKGYQEDEDLDDDREFSSVFLNKHVLRRRY